MYPFDIFKRLFMLDPLPREREPMFNPQKPPFYIKESTRRDLIHIIALRIEQTQCKKEQYPCNACVETGRVVAEVILPLLDKLAGTVYATYTAKVVTNQSFDAIIDKVVMDHKLDQWRAPIRTPIVDPPLSIKRPTRGKY